MKKKRCERKPKFTNLSDIGKMSALYDNSVLASLRPFQKEAVFRNTVGLFNTRQNLFTILIGVEKNPSRSVWVSRSAPGPTGWKTTSFSDQRAVAVVWRDPFVDANGHRQTVVRFFKYLSQ